MSSRGPERKSRAGIVSIERQMMQKSQKNSQSVNQAFEDLSKLMGSAKEMVVLAKNIAEEIRAKRGAISDDETVQLKSYLLSLGIDDPVTKEGSKSSYFSCLAEEVVKILKQPIEDCGGIMTLTDAYVRVNRARGFEVKQCAGISAIELSETVRLPVILAGERLLLLEEKGLLCRDESIEGLRFFFNLFLHESSDL
ncbi:unnamed protein product [Soboliphyme baturini]|uniref:Vacuolar protein-sorting-associated protein 36 n=1 Tax=Soboliphyme baturini TaxID=241478 RepID=A0A183IQC8_9BILA|nr:unnamed protein product [Soboliphyme baturini]